MYFYNIVLKGVTQTHLCFQTVETWSAGQLDYAQFRSRRRGLRTSPQRRTPQRHALLQQVALYLPETQPAQLKTSSSVQAPSLCCSPHVGTDPLGHEDAIKQLDPTNQTRLSFLRQWRWFVHFLLKNNSGVETEEWEYDSEDTTSFIRL